MRWVVNMHKVLYKSVHKFHSSWGRRATAADGPTMPLSPPPPPAHPLDPSANAAVRCRSRRHRPWRHCRHWPLLPPPLDLAGSSPSLYHLSKIPTDLIFVSYVYVSPISTYPHLFLFRFWFIYMPTRHSTKILQGKINLNLI